MNGRKQGKPTWPKPQDLPMALPYEYFKEFRIFGEEKEKEKGKKE